MSSRPSTDRTDNARLLIVQTGSTFPHLRARRGDFPHWFRVGMGLDRSQVDVVRPYAGDDLPPNACRPSGVIITGSPAMVSERLAWSENTAGWLRSIVDHRIPVLGVCYGHQLLAHAFGGRVDYHPSGREIGTVRIERLAAAHDDALLGNAPDTFHAHASHQQSVLELPPDAVLLASSTHDPHHAVRYAPNVWGLQFHPEFSAGIMRDYLQRRQGAMNGDCPADCCAERTDAPTPVARRMLRRFREIARPAIARSA